METNRIYLGDAYELIKQVPDKSVDCVYTDVPYAIKLGKCSGCGLKFRTDRENIKEIRERGLDKGVKPELWDEVDRILRKNNIFVWCSKEQIPYLLDRYVTKRGWKFAILVWCKRNSTPFAHQTWLPDVEYCLHLFKGISLNDGIQNKSKWYMSAANTYDKKKFDHPTMKPIKLLARLIRNSSKPLWTVLDLFGGSGSTLIACEQLNRRCRTMEYDPRYCDVIIKRWETLTGKKAEVLE